MQKKLTARTIETIEPPSEGRMQLWDTTLPGFGLRVSSKGKKSWVLMYRLRDRQRRMTIGSYPAFSLAQARAEAMDALRSVEKGVDPAEAKITAKRKRKVSFDETIDQFITLYAKPKNRGWKETERILKNHVAPHFRNMSLQDISRHHVIDLLDGIVARGAPIQANRILAAIRKLFNWALDRGLIDNSPITGLKPVSKEQSRDRVLSDDEIKFFWSACNDMGWPFGTLFQMLLVTGQRRNEVTSMRWSDIDLKANVWTIPREIAKSDRAHDVPLSPLALKLLQSVPRIDQREYLFSTTGRNPVSGFGRSKRQLDELSGVEEWRLHDLRRTAASGMARLGIAPHVIEKILNHASGTISGVAAVYNRHGYEEEKRQALEAWSLRLETLTE